MGAEQSVERTWAPGTFFNPSNDEASKPFALLILNQEITDLALFETLHKNSRLVICADGGANRIYDSYSSNEQRFAHMPNCISGDLDSLRPEVRDFYASLGVQIRKVNDQDSTDFGKCLDWISEQAERSPPVLEANEGEGEGEVKVSGVQPEITVIALGGFGGRVDHSFHSINTLYTTAHTHTIFLLSPENLTFLLPVGRNTIHAPHSTFGPTCGLIPVGRSSYITTAGLEWDLHDRESKFGGMVSTSNHLKSEVILVDVSKSPAVFTLELRQQRTRGVQRSVSCF